MRITVAKRPCATVSVPSAVGLRCSVRKAIVTQGFLALLIAFPAVANEAGDREWSRFRSRYPYHTQAMALSEPVAGDGARMLVLSEPPPHATVEGVKGIVGDALVELTIKTQPVGHDGWSRDLVLIVRETGRDPLRRVLSDLHRYLFYTNHKAEILPLPPPAEGDRPPLDAKVTPAELRQWTLEAPRGLFRPVGGGPGRTLRDIMKDGPPGVFACAEERLVAWAIPRRKDLTGLRAHARQFAVESDLVIGALSNIEHLAVVGRERRVPRHILPPLRTETLMLLAGTGLGELAQSYERNTLFAGKMPDGKDWAPIYLSPVLVDSEYGGLLDITDQMLKSWSEHGNIEYLRFDYPKPKTFPFDGPIMRLLGTPRLVYNWNTKGAGYASLGDDFDVYALHRTGALPVSYLPEGLAEQHPFEREQQAYDYFAGLGDPNLVRVVQYAALYQIFTKIGIKAKLDPPLHSEADGTNVLRAEARAAVRRIRELDDPARAEIVDRLARRGMARTSRP